MTQMNNNADTVDFALRIHERTWNYQHEICWARRMVPYQCFYCDWVDVMAWYNLKKEN